MIRTKRRIDNFIILSHELIAPANAASSNGPHSIENMLKKYRQEINPELLFVSVDLSGRGVSILETQAKHPNDILITGFSDSILRFIAERGDNNQLRYVENIDVSLKLAAHSAPKLPAHLKELDKLDSDSTDAPLINENLNTAQEWKTARVFISSTFVDMHAERDVLTRHVFPELRERCKKKRINVVEVDLRWGVTEEETQQNKSVEVCVTSSLHNTYVSE